MKKSLLFFASSILVMMVAGVFLAEQAAARHRQRLNQSAQLFSNFRNQNSGFSPSYPTFSSPSGRSPGPNPSSTPAGGDGGSSENNSSFYNLDVLNRLRVGDDESGNFSLVLRKIAGEATVRGWKGLFINIKDVVSGIRFAMNGVVKIVMTAGGNLGIGTEAPNEKLEVVGNAKITGTVSSGVVKTNKLCLPITGGKCYVDVCDGRLSEVPCATGGSVGKLTTSFSIIGQAAQRPRISVDNLSSIIWKASGGKVTVNKIKFKLTGLALSGAAPFKAEIIDSSTNGPWGNSTGAFCLPEASKCEVAFEPDFVIADETAKSTKLRINSSSFNDTPNSSDSLSVQVPNGSYVTLTDGSVDEKTFPWNVADVSYE